MAGGKKLLDKARRTMIEIEGVKVCVRSLSARQAFQMQPYMDGGNLDVKQMLKEEPGLLGKIVSDCCSDPEGGPFFETPEEALDLDFGHFTQISQALMSFSEAPKEEDLKN